MTKKRLRLLVVAVVVVGLAVLAPTSAGAATRDVSIIEFAFVPSEVTINVGDEVRWTNQGSTVHTVTTNIAGQPPFDSGHLNPGQTYRVTFSSSGRFFYFCNLHNFMQGVVVVSGSSTSTSTSTTAPPASATIINPTNIEPGDSFTASATGVSSADSAYRLRLGTSSANCPSGLALGGTRNSDASRNIPSTSRIIPTNATSGVRWLCWVRTGDPGNRSTPTSVTIV